MADPNQFEEHTIIGSGGARRLHADIYRPKRSNGAGVLMIHGGGWRMGSKGMMPPQAQALANRGFTCLATEYRLRPRHPWPAQIHDVKTAIRWFRANADALDVDPARIAVLGNSAGGHLALLLAGTVGLSEFEGDGGNPGTDTTVAAVIAVYPPVEFYVGDRTSGGTAASALLGENADPDAARAASPMTYVREDFPPTFFLHGNGDTVVPVSASIKMYNALCDAGARAEMHIYAEQPHTWARWPKWVQPTMDEAALFLDRYVVDPASYGRPSRLPA